MAVTVNQKKRRPIQPAIWDDYEFGTASLGAELIFMGLITQADDDGYLLGSPKWVNSQLFPHKEDIENSQIKEWLEELHQAGLINLFLSNSKAYIWLPNWHKHQSMDARYYTPSGCPLAPNDEVTQSARRDYAERSAGGRRRADGPHALKRSEVKRSEVKRKTPASGDTGSKGRKKKLDPDSVPNDFPVDLVGSLDRALPVLVRTAEARDANKVTRLAVARAIQAFPDRDHVKSAGEVEHWLCHGNGQKAAAKDIVARYRNFLDNAPAIARRRSGSASYGADVV